MCMTVYWRDEEVRLLLSSLLEQSTGLRVMLSTHRPTLSLFRRVAADLTRTGYPCSAISCRAKFKCLKGGFSNVVEHYRWLPPPKDQSPFYEELAQLARSLFPSSE